MSEVPNNLQNQFLPIVSSNYTKPIAQTLFNYKQALQDPVLEKFLKNTLTCDCFHSPYIYGPTGHVITWGLKIFKHENTRKKISYGPI